MTTMLAKDFQAVKDAMAAAKHQLKFYEEMMGIKTNDQAYQTPLIDLLRSIPSDARMVYEETPTSSHSIPVGRLAAEAVAEIERLTAEVKATKQDALRYRWLKSREDMTLRTERAPVLWSPRSGTAFHGTYSLSEGGTWHTPAASMDALIDAAMKEQP